LADIPKLIYDTLSPLGYEVKQQGTYSADAALPETFITYWLSRATPTGHYNNATVSMTYELQIVLYSLDPTIQQGADALLRSALSQADFLCGDGQDITFSEITRHYAYGMRIKYYLEE
jgi:hypothetical protein